MLAICSSDRKMLFRLRAALPAAQFAVATTDWILFERAAHQASCLIVHLENLRTSADWHHFSALRTVSSGTPVVLVTGTDPDSLRLVKGVPIEEIVWSKDLEKELVPAVNQALSSAFLHRLAASLDSAPDLHPTLRHPLADACRSEQPVRTVKRLAGIAGCSPATLSRHWRAAVPDTRLRLEDFLRTLTLARCSRELPEGGLADIAAAAGVHARTLRRWARYLQLDLHSNASITGLMRRFVEALRIPGIDILEPLVQIAPAALVQVPQAPVQSLL